MLVLFRKISFILILNTTLFLILMVGIQNSSYRKKVNLLIGESVNLPLSFVVGISFISGSLMGSLITNNLSSQKNSF